MVATSQIRHPLTFANGLICGAVSLAIYFLSEGTQISADQTDNRAWVDPSSLTWLHKRQLCGHWQQRDTSDFQSFSRTRHLTYLTLLPTGEAQVKASPHWRSGQLILAKPATDTTPSADWQLTVGRTEIGFLTINKDELTIRVSYEGTPREYTLQRQTRWTGFLAEDLPTSVWKERLVADERLIQEMTLRKGIREGKSARFYSDGARQNEADYVKGQKHGIEREWERDGRLTAERNYSEGKLHGSSIEFDGLGNVAAKLDYRHGKPWTGRYVTRHPDGTVFETGTYLEGAACGEWQTFDQFGKQVMTTNFECKDFVKK